MDSFDGWIYLHGRYTNNTFSTPFDFFTPITTDITLFAKWKSDFVFTFEPTADENFTLLSTIDGTMVFDASASEGSLVVWDFGDGTSATGIYQTHYYSTPGNYTIKPMVYNDDGKVYVKEYSVMIPGGITRVLRTGHCHW